MSLLDMLCLGSALSLRSVTEALGVQRRVLDFCYFVLSSEEAFRAEFFASICPKHHPTPPKRNLKQRPNAEKRTSRNTRVTVRVFFEKFFAPTGGSPGQRAGHSRLIARRERTVAA